MTLNLPTRDALKAQAKRLRADLAAQGKKINHAQALESLAHQWGFSDWNTLSAKAAAPNRPMYAVGQRVRGAYLGHPFVATVKAAQSRGTDYWALTLVFDDPIDVVASEGFSSFRRQVNCTVNASGQTVQKISGDIPHVSLTL